MNSKIAIRQNALVIHNHDSWVDWVYRMYNNDNRRTTISFLENLYNEILQMIHSGTLDHVQHDRLQRALNDSIPGFQLLVNQYWNDLQSRCSFEVLKENFTSLVGTTD